MIHVSNFRKIKRLPDVVDAFFKVRAKMPVKLLLVGDGPERRRINEYVKDHPFKKDILFLGKQENIEELFAISDLILLLSEKESFGLVLLEAMACGVPGIGTNIGGIPEVIEHGRNGFIVELGDTDAVAKNAIDILSDEQKLQQFRERAFASLEERFHSENIVKQYEEIYYQLTEGSDE